MPCTRSASHTKPAPAKYNPQPAKCSLQPACFAIPTCNKAMEEEVWVKMAPHAIWCGIPKKQQYIHHNGVLYFRCHNPWASFPCPLQHQQAWTQLCYFIMYLIQEWKAWLEAMYQLPAGAPKKSLDYIANNNSTLASPLPHDSAAYRSIIKFWILGIIWGGSCRCLRASPDNPPRSSSVTSHSCQMNCISHWRKLMCVICSSSARSRSHRGV